MKGAFWRTLLIALFVIGVGSRQGMLVVFAFILAVATAASELWGRFGLSNVSYRRHLGSDRIPYGEETSLVLEFVNAKPLPLAWLLVRDRYPGDISLLTAGLGKGSPHRSARLVSLLSLRWYERVTRTHRIRGDHRGIHRFGPAELVSGDMFGAARHQRVDSEVDTLVVYPKVVPVHAADLPAGRPMGEWLARRCISPDPLRFSMVRDYSPGDNPRYIHWKATAHTLGLQTKVFDPSDTLTLTVAVDVQTSPRSYVCVSDYLEYVISAAASLAVHALDERHAVGLCANGLGGGGQRCIRIKPGRHPQQMANILTALSSLSSFRGMPFDKMLATIIPSLQLGETVVAITAAPQEPVYEVLAALKEAGHGTMLLTVGDAEATIPEQLASYHLGGRDAWHQLATLDLG